MDKKELTGHIPVLKDELLKILNLRPGMVVIDATTGLGGHAASVLDQIGPTGVLIALDLDEKNLNLARHQLKANKNIFFYHERFDNLQACLNKAGFKQADAIYFDLGLSSPHVDEAERGFSFSVSGPLDMRYDRSGQITLETAENLVNTLSETELKKIFWLYGEEKQARVVARAIVKRREKEKITSTKQLADLVASVVRPKPGKHPATKIFQALRIAVNDELDVLERTLTAALKNLKTGGRLAVISYHSLEDRIVKNFLKAKAKGCVCPPQLPICQCHHQPEIKIISKKPIVPSEVERQTNPRSRSAKLRAGEKIHDIDETEVRTI